MNGTFTNASSTASLEWLMEQKQKAEIGQRIKDLRDNSAETTRSIGDYCGVGERSVAAWIAGKGIAYDNAQKVAELFGVDVDWLWRGEAQSSTGPVLGYKVEDVVRAERMEAKLDALLAHFKVEWLEPDDAMPGSTAALRAAEEAAAKVAPKKPAQSRKRQRR